MKIPKRLSIVLVLLAAIVFVFPVEVVCGVPGYTCRSGPDATGKSSVYYEVEPWGIMLLETMLRTSVPVYYTSGYHRN